MGRKKTGFEESATYNAWSYRLYFDRLYEIALSRFQWDGRPESVDERYLEMTLFNKGMAIYFKDEVMGDLALSVLTNGSFDVYGNPYLRRAYSVYNQYQKLLKYNESVIIYNNYRRTNSMLDIKVYAQRLWNYDRIIDVNVNAQKTPVLLVGTDKQQLTLKNIYLKYDGNEPVIYGDSAINLESLKVLKTDAPFISDKIYALKQSIWNEALTYLGVANVTMEKKERMIESEVQSQQGGTFANRFSPLACRREAAKKINKMFGTNIEVNYRTEWEDGELDMPNQYEDKQGVDE